MDALKEDLARLEALERETGAHLAVFTEHAEPGPLVSQELSELSARLGTLAADLGQLAADAALAATRLTP